jgi:phosphoribosylformylglycinamidine synthase PurS subunit
MHFHPPGASIVKVQVQIRLKKGVADPEGENTLKALNLLGFKGLSAVRSAKLFEIDLEEENREMVKEQVEEMCRRLLSNPVIQDYRIELAP